MVTLTGGVDGYLQTILSSKGDAAGETEVTTGHGHPAHRSSRRRPSLAAALRAEPTIQQVLKQACSVEQALVGVGTPAPDATIVQMGYLTKADARRAARDGCGR